MIEFMVPGRPVPAARMTRRGKWLKANAQRYLAYRDQVGWHARMAVEEPLKGPLSVEIRVYWHGGRPGDADNIAKAILDGCNGIIWDDDTQIEELHVYREVGKPQRAEMRVWRREERELLPPSRVTEGSLDSLARGAG